MSSSHNRRFPNTLFPEPLLYRPFIPDISWLSYMEDVFWPSFISFISLDSLRPNQLSAFHKAGPKTWSIYSNVMCQTNVQLPDQHRGYQPDLIKNLMPLSFYLPFNFSSKSAACRSVFHVFGSSRVHISVPLLHVTLERPWLRHVNRTIKTNNYDDQNSN